MIRARPTGERHRRGRLLLRRTGRASLVNLRRIGGGSNRGGARGRGPSPDRAPAWRPDLLLLVAQEGDQRLLARDRVRVDGQLVGLEAADQLLVLVLEELVGAEQ